MNSVDYFEQGTGIYEFEEVKVIGIKAFDSIGAIRKLRHTSLMIFLLLPVFVTGGHISEIALT